MKKISYLLMLLALTACIAKPPEPLVYGATTWLGYEPAYIAREMGFLDKDQVHLAEFTNTTEVIRAFRNGRLQVAALTLDEALSLRASVPDLQIFMVADISNGADVLIARRGINRLSQLKGKRIGVEKTARGAYFLNLILGAAALTTQDVHIVSLPVDEQADAFRAGRVDAVVTFSVGSAELLRHGAVALYDSSKVPGKIVDTLVVRAVNVGEYNEQLLQFVQAWFRALHLIQTDPVRSYPIMALREHVQDAEIEAALHGLRLQDLRQNHLQLTGAPAPLLSAAIETQRALKQAGLTTGSDDLSLLINPRIVAESIAVKTGILKTGLD